MYQRSMSFFQRNQIKAYENKEGAACTSFFYDPGTGQAMIVSALFS